MSVLDKKHFKTEAAAFRYLENILWNEGVVCPHCGSVDSAGRLKGVKDKKGRVRASLWKCYAKECRKQFRVTVGTVFESMLIPLHKALQAVHLLCSSKKGISAHQLSRTLELDYKSAWFLAHRIREAMRDGTLAPMGGSGQTVEADETYIGRLEGVPKQRHGGAHKNVVLTLVERGGSARSFHVDSTSIADIVPVVRQNVRRESHFMTDEAQHYKALGREFESHGRVEHTAEEYVRYPQGDNPIIHSNTVENYYSIFKRGMKGIYQHCAEKHLHRYLAEFDFRYSNRVRLGIDDENRAARALKGITGKRLTYRRTDENAPM
ncbi:MAG TPA: IS1595 family transposase [Xanthobacteraceae bacterium]|jgi:transposase-like protein|nr:IS1595 family transposase [Xanthobacteraceae bacterium]